MPELDYAVLCEFAKTDQSGLAYVIGAGMDTVSVDEVPVAVNLGLLIRLKFSPGEEGRPHRIEVVVMHTDGGRVAQVLGIMEPKRAQGLPLGWKTGALFAFNLGIPFEQFGVYSVEVLVNDSSAKSIDLRLIPAKTTP